MLKRLEGIADVDGSTTTPRYSPHDHKSGIVHLGIGAFHRAHQAVMTDDALAQCGGDWRIIGVSMRSQGLAQRLNAQNGLYTVIERAPSSTSARVIGAIERVIAADAAATLSALSAPNIRIVTLTVTENGYGIDRATGMPDRTSSIVAADLAHPAAPLGVLGLLVAAIKRRRAENKPLLTVLSCDNLPDNGAFLRKGVVEFARMLGEEDLADWIAKNIAFPSSMVDRITPASTSGTYLEASRQTGCDDQAAVETEPFSQWVIEDKFASGRPNWEAGGALFVKDVAPYEKMKLTMLNGAHSMMAYAGFLTGCKYVRDVMDHPALAKLVERHLSAAAGLLHPLRQIDFGDYATALLDRFANPAIAHETYQIATDGSQKMPQRIFAPAIKAVETGQPVLPFAFATAMWMRFCSGRADDGSNYEVRDPRAEELIGAATVENDATSVAEAFHDLPNLIPERLAEHSEWNAALIGALSAEIEL